MAGIIALWLVGVVPRLPTLEVPDFMSDQHEVSHELKHRVVYSQSSGS